MTLLRLRTITVPKRPKPCAINMSLKMLCVANALPEKLLPVVLQVPFFIEDSGFMRAARTHHDDFVNLLDHDLNNWFKWS